jgi:predicted nucleic acid-binding protein
MILNPQDNYLFDTTFFSDLLDQQDIGITIEELESFGEGRSGYSIVTLAELCAAGLRVDTYALTA